MKKVLVFIARGCALGLIAGMLFIVIQLMNAIIFSDAAILERMSLFSSVYLGREQVGVLNSFELATSLLYHALFSMVVGIMFSGLLKLGTNFSQLRPTVITSAIFGLLFWLVLFYFVEPVLLGSTLLQSETNISKQLLIEGVIFAIFGSIAFSVFRRINE